MPVLGPLRTPRFAEPPIAGKVCPLCFGEGQKLANSEYRVCQRGHAPIGLSWPWESVEQYERYYTDISQFHTAQQAQEGFPSAIDRDGEHLQASRQRMQIYCALLPGVFSVLDVGTGTGSFVRAATENGWKAHGVEPCEELATWATKQGRSVWVGSWQCLHGGREKFDAVHLSDVLEHLTRPVECLEACMKMMATDGVLIVEMPEWDINRPECKRHMRPQQHICLFSRDSAEEMYSRLGLKTVAFWRPLAGRLGKQVHILKRSY